MYTIYLLAKGQKPKGLKHPCCVDLQDKERSCGPLVCHCRSALSRKDLNLTLKIYTKLSLSCNSTR